MLSKYFIVQIAENPSYCIGKEVKTGIPDNPSPDEIEIKKKIATCFSKPTPIFTDLEMKVSGNSTVRFFKICLCN